MHAPLCTTRLLLFGFLAATLACGPSGSSSRNPPSGGSAGDAAPEQARPGVQGGGAAQRAPWPPEAPGETLELVRNPLAANYYVVLDGSGSMGGSGCSGDRTRTQVAKAALAEFVAAIPAHANVGLLAFDQKGVTERVPLGADNREVFVQAVQAVGADRDTPLGTAIARGYAALTAQARRQLGYGEYHLVIVTDGAASNGEDPTSIVDRILRESPVVIHTIGFCIDSRHALNQAGRILYHSANSAEELRAGLGEVLAESPRFDATSF